MTPCSETEQILDLARWTPSADNSQPWRFEMGHGSTVRIHLRNQAGKAAYDYNGPPTLLLLSAGMLLETLRIAAACFGRGLSWSYRQASEHRHVIDLDLPRVARANDSDLAAFIKVRSVNRQPMRLTRLTPEQRASLSEAAGPELLVSWHESASARWQATRTNMLAADIRLRIPETFEVHRAIIDWRPGDSATGIPATAVGFSRPSRAIMRWALQSWQRMSWLNRCFGTALAQLELDLLPGLACAAHFSVSLRESPFDSPDEVVLLHAGMGAQRLWLTATQLGLTLQPTMAPLVFAHYGRHDVAFTRDHSARRLAKVLSARLDAEYNAGEHIVFRGRVGLPISRGVSPRSVRQSLEVLMQPWDDAGQSWEKAS